MSLYQHKNRWYTTPEANGLSSKTQMTRELNPTTPSQWGKEHLIPTSSFENLFVGKESKQTEKQKENNK